MPNGVWKNIERFNSYKCNIRKLQRYLLQKLVIVIVNFIHLTFSACGVVVKLDEVPECYLIEGISSVLCSSCGGYNGEDTLAKYWPWHVAIFRYINSTLPSQSPTYICGGTLIRSGVVITSAHCISDLKRKKPLPTNEFIVILQPVSGHYQGNFRSRYTMDGRRIHYLYQNEVQIHNVCIYLIINSSPDIPKSSSDFISQVTEIHIPSTYDYFNFQSDIAILRLDSDTNFDGYIRPICLPYDLDQDYELLQGGQIGTVCNT